MRLDHPRAGVIGFPVAHSRSPRIHNEWLRRHNIDGNYVLLPTPPEALAARLRQLRDDGFAGANVTIPHKEQVLALCDRLAPSAERAGAVNTLVFAPDGITGMNTDGEGFLANLRAHGVNPSAGPALILGAGGAARAIAAALRDAGAAVTLCNRSAARADALAAALGGAQVLAWAKRETALANVALLVNTTSLGMAGQPPLELALRAAPPDLVVADIVYAPLRTPLLAAAAERCGLRTVGGLGMLLHQAVAGFEAWFGVRPVVDEALYDIAAAP